MSTVQDKLDEHEKRINRIEVDSARLDERLEALVKSTNNLKWSMFCFSFLMLLALVYGALGPKGFNAVTTTQQAQIQNQAK